MAQAGTENGPPDLGEGRVVTRTREVPDRSFRAFLTQASVPRVAWATPAGLELVGSGAAALVRATGPDRFDSLREDAAELFADVDATGPSAARPRMVGGFAFDAEHTPTLPWEGFPAALFVLPEVQLTRSEDRTWLSVTVRDPDATPASVETRLDELEELVADLPVLSPSGDRPGVAATRRTTTEIEWTGGVDRAVSRIRAGDLRKVVLATALEADLESTIDLPALFERFRRTYPDCFRFLVQPTPEAGFVGPPPERLVRMTDSHVETEALAGSVERGDTPEEDAELARSLETDAKLGHEQALVAETIRECLAPLGTVTVGERTIRKLANIQHLETPITTDLSDRKHVLDVVEALHPTPAVGGLPPERAHEVIGVTESFDRGWYAAPVGWFDAAGNGEFAVAIRSAVAGGRRATLFAGNGIVGNSNSEEEWAELGPKFRPVLDELERR